LGGTQLDNTSNVQTTPNLTPDIIAKIALDPIAQAHIEVAGMERNFKVYDSATNTYSTKVGAGGSLNANLEVVKGFRLITNQMWGQGIGRYFFGTVPDLIVRANGDVSPMHAGGWVEGFEATLKNTLLYGYYSGVYIGRDVALDANGTTLIGYGFRGASNNDNKTIQEVSFGFNQTIWKDARYGAINVMGQYEYLLRNPWYIAANAPKGTHDNTIYVNVRYTLPGGPPAPRKKP
jgi:hypothetical protein